MYGKHTSTTSLIKKLIFQGKKTKLPSIYPRFTIKYIWKDQKWTHDQFLFQLRCKDKVNFLSFLI